MHDKDMDPITEQEVALDDSQDIASLEEDYSDSNNNNQQDEKPLRVTDVDYSDLDDVQTTL
jgi:hypothetical protein